MQKVKKMPICTLMLRILHKTEKHVRLFFAMLLLYGGICLEIHAAEPSRVDLAVDAIQFQPLRPTPDQPVTVLVLIRNKGTESAANFYLSAKLRRGGRDIKVIEDIPVISTFPSGGTGLAIPISLGLLVEGFYDVVATADSTNLFLETNEENNQSSSSLEIFPSR